MQSTEMTLAIVSPDEEFRLAVRDAAEDRQAPVALELPVAAGQVTEGHLKQIQLCQPRVIVLDLDGDPKTGCKLAQHLAEAHPAAHVVVGASDQSPEILMAAMRAGVAEFVEKPADEGALDEAFERLARKVTRDAAVPREGRIYAFFSPKGGGGSTTVASNFAIQLHLLTGKRVLLADFDLELGEVAIFLGLEPHYSLVDLVTNLHRLDDGLLQTYVVKHGSGIEMLAAPHRPRQADEVTNEQVRRALQFLRERYDYVVVDVSNSLGRHAVQAFDLADDVLVVSQIDVPSVRNIQRCETMFKTLEANRPKVRLVVNRFDGGGDLTLPDVEETLDRSVYWTISNDYDAVAKSMNLGEPLVTRVSSETAREIEGLVGKITGIPVERSEKKSLLGRVLGKRREKGGDKDSTPVERSASVERPRAAFATGGDQS